MFKLNCSYLIHASDVLSIDSPHALSSTRRMATGHLHIFMEYLPLYYVQWIQIRALRFRFSHIQPNVLFEKLKHGMHSYTNSLQQLSYGNGILLRVNTIFLYKNIYVDIQNILWTTWSLLFCVKDSNEFGEWIQKCDAFLSVRFNQMFGIVLKFYEKSNYTSDHS